MLARVARGISAAVTRDRSQETRQNRDFVDVAVHGTVPEYACRVCRQGFTWFDVVTSVYYFCDQETHEVCQRELWFGDKYVIKSCVLCKGHLEHSIRIVYGSEKRRSHTTWNANYWIRDNVDSRKGFRIPDWTQSSDLGQLNLTLQRALDKGMPIWE